MTLLIFDCDGVLVDSEILHAHVECQIGQDLLDIKRDVLAHSRLFMLAPEFETVAKVEKRP